MTILFFVTLIWALIASYGWFYNYKSANSWRAQFMVAQGCDTRETRKWMSGTR